MRKTLPDVARYLKEILVPATREAYAIHPAYANLSNEENIREGILSFRAFLVRYYDAVAAKGDLYDTSTKVAHEYENRTTLSVYFPCLHTVSALLMNIGYQGTPGGNAQALACGAAVLSAKLSVAKSLECLRFLADCGICFGGIDLNDKKQNLQDIKTLTVAYPDDPAMLTGLKIMAIAELEHGTLVNQGVFLRCDYRAIKANETDVGSIVRDTITPLSKEVQDFILRLHRRHLDRGLTCVVEVKGFHIYIKYCYKRKDVWGVNASLNNGYHINVKPTKSHEYADAIKTFSPILQELIAKGYGCGRKREVGHCDGGCRGLPILLDDSVLEIRGDIDTWLDRELSCLQRK